ncbi:MAG: hypothetical protein A2051_03100 [Desulfovibrionales bacterium GWA2_65_9]|nr:MAG: hypothetical protein A2051_03100 [Desulfovibrionales bacterium GWA2_65_9]
MLGVLSSLPALAAAPKPGEVWREPATGMEFAWVPGGCFDMGCGPWTQDCELYEYPVHRVCVDGFWLGRFEVTQDQWRRVMGASPAANQGDGALPVELVSWHEAKAFAERLSSLGAGVFRLPTEAQWEFAARSGGRPERFAGGAPEDAAGWNYENSGGRSHPAGGKAGNGLGLFDMTGNVFEWCADVFDRGFYARSPRNNPLCTDPGGTPADWRVRRGGSFGNLARDTRTAMRGKLEPGSRDEFTGLRLLREPGGK